MEEEEDFAETKTMNETIEKQKSSTIITDTIEVKSIQPDGSLQKTIIRFEDRPQIFKIGENILNINMEKRRLSTFGYVQTDISSLNLRLMNSNTDKNFCRIEVHYIPGKVIGYPKQFMEEMIQLRPFDNIRITVIPPEDDQEDIQPDLQNQLSENSHNQSLSRDRETVIMILPSPIMLRQEPIREGILEKKWCELINGLSWSLPPSVMNLPIVVVVPKNSEYINKLIMLDGPEKDTQALVYIPSSELAPKPQMTDHETVEDFSNLSPEMTVIVFASQSEYTLMVTNDKPDQSLSLSTITNDIYFALKNTRDEINDEITIQDPKLIDTALSKISDSRAETDVYSIKKPEFITAWTEQKSAESKPYDYLTPKERVNIVN